MLTLLSAFSLERDHVTKAVNWGGRGGSAQATDGGERPRLGWRRRLGTDRTVGDVV